MLHRLGPRAPRSVVNGIDDGAMWPDTVGAVRADRSARLLLAAEGVLMSEQSDDPGFWGSLGGSFDEPGNDGETVDLTAFAPPAPPAPTSAAPSEQPVPAGLFAPGGAAPSPSPFGVPPPAGAVPFDAPPPPSPSPAGRPLSVVPPPDPAPAPGPLPFEPQAPLPPPPAAPVPPASAPPQPRTSPEPALFSAAVPPGPAPAIPPQPARPVAQAAPAAKPSGPSAAKPKAASPSKRREKILLGVLGVVVVAAALWFFLLRGGDDEASDTVAPATTATATTAASGAAEAPGSTAAGASGAPVAGAANTARSGNGTQTVELTFPEPKPSLAFLALTSTQSGPFTVTAIGADGSQGARMIEASGPFEGNRMLLPAADGSLPTKVEVVAPGAWTLDVRDVSTAVQAGVNAGTGSTVLYYRGAGGELGFRHDGPGSFVIRSYQSGQPQDIVSVTGPNQGTAQLPGGPYPIEIVTDGSWLLTAQQ